MLRYRRLKHCLHPLNNKSTGGSTKKAQSRAYEGSATDPLERRNSMTNKPANAAFPLGKAKEFIKQAQKLNLDAVNHLYCSAVMFQQSATKASLKSYIQYLESELPKSSMDTELKKNPKPVSPLAGASDPKKVQDS